jgi:phenylacetate-coenzyme A ligase PaaK-like adenylate-forming protein
MEHDKKRFSETSTIDSVGGGESYQFGVFERQSIREQDVSRLLSIAKSKTTEFASIPIASVIDVLDKLSLLWTRGSPYWERAFEITKEELSFSSEMIAASLDVIPSLLSRRNVTSRLLADFESIQRLDEFVDSPHFQGRDRAFPLGVVFHVSAGNVFLGAIDSLLMGFLTKNVSIVKLSSRNTRFPLLFARSILEVDAGRVLSNKFSLIHFKGGSVGLEKVIKSEANAIIAWGGEEMIQSYKRDLPMATKFIEYGPKISFQLVTKDGLQALGQDFAASSIAGDVCMWDQAACASPQNLFLSKDIDKREFLEKVARAFQDFPIQRGLLTDDECVEHWKEKARGEYFELTGAGMCFSGESFLVNFDGNKGLKPSPLNRALIVREFDSVDDLLSQLKPFAKHLQSCSFLLGDQEKDTYLNALGSAGVMRFAQLGHVMSAPIGAPHDGKMTLVELTRIVPEEFDVSLTGFINDSIRHVPFYHQMRGGLLIKSIDEMPLVSGADFATDSQDKLQFFSHSGLLGGYVFSSGGTSGRPKYAAYSHSEFSKVAELLARGFAAQGVKRGSVVANVFIAGGMWSSFMAVDHALAKLEAKTLPIGGLTNFEQTLVYLEQFHADFLVGLPTQILELARFAESKNIKITVSNVLYAGEHLSEVAKRFIQRVFGVQYFGSAGYASVDAGPVGYQCAFVRPGEHHLFEDQVYMEIIEGQGVVTSLIRRQMPVIRLKTGDLIEWTSSQGQICKCGRSDRRFMLFGRSDSQFNIWGCRLFLQDVDAALADSGGSGAVFQVLLDSDTNGVDQLSVHVESVALSQNKLQFEASFKDRFYALSRDLHGSHPRPWIEGKLKVVFMDAGGIERVQRTGKIKAIVDHRR